MSKKKTKRGKMNKKNSKSEQKIDHMEETEELEIQADTESIQTKGSLHSEAWPQMNRSNIAVQSKFHSKIA